MLRCFAVRSQVSDIRVMPGEHLGQPQTPSRPAEALTPVPKTLSLFSWQLINSYTCYISYVHTKVLPKSSQYLHASKVTG